MTSTAPAAEQAVAANRFGLGLRGDEPAPSDARDWLLDQLTRYEAPAVFATARSAPDITTEFIEGRRELKNMDAAAKMAARKALREKGRGLYRSEVEMRTLAALRASAPFIERLVHFWSNHFAVSANKPLVSVLAGAFEREAIRPHVLGRFEDMLFAVERHPAMLIFLDQPGSTGPNSPAALRAATATERPHRRGINENLAREIMELHTLGVRTGYSQQDVTEFALALTGWSLDRLRAEQDGQAGVFRFRPGRHEPGARTIMGRTYAQTGEEQARAILRDLAAADTTARHIATKLARHFIADDPPPVAVDRLSRAFLQSKGHLPTVYRELIEAPEVWTSPPAKFKTPWEWLLSALRGLGRGDLDGLAAAQLMNQLGQPVWRPGSPAGYDDVVASWAAPDALVRRVEVAQRLIAKAGDELDPRSLAQKLLPSALSPLTEAEIARAESTRTGLALLLVSPEFLRR